MQSIQKLHNVFVGYTAYTCLQNIKRFDNYYCSAE